MRITLLAPRLPPAVCGVGDHTCRLAEALEALGCVVGLVHTEPRDEGATLPGTRVDRWARDAPSLGALLRDCESDWLWVQMSGYGYSRHGAPLSLARVLERVRREQRTVRIAVYLHETHWRPGQTGTRARLGRLDPRGPVRHFMQRTAIGRLARSADVVMTSIGRYARQIRSEYAVAPERIHVLAVGANLPSIVFTREDRQRQRAALGWAPDEVVGVAFGLAETQAHAITACRRCIERGFTAGVLDRLVCVGGTTPGIDPRLASALQGLSAKVEALGHRSGRRIAELLECCDVAFTGNSPATLGKSGSYAAYARAGLAVIAPANDTDADGDDGMRSLAADSFAWGEQPLDAISGERRAMRELARDRLEWPTIASAALEILEAAAHDERAAGATSLSPSRGPGPRS